MRSPYGFIKTATRGSSYCTSGGAYWIIKHGSVWHLWQMGNKSEGRERLLLGKFASLTEAAAHYKKEVAA